MSKYLKDLKMIEMKNSKILCVSHGLVENKDWQIVLRPLGISVLVRSSCLSTLAGSVNLKLLENQQRQSTNFNSYNKVVEFLFLVTKSYHPSQLNLFDDFIAEKPSKLKQSCAKLLTKGKH